MVKYKKGDLLEASEDIIAHGVNCVGGFGSGVAGQIAKKYPHARDSYLNKFDNEGWELGDVQLLGDPSMKHMVANCATQFEFFPRDVCNADYPAIVKTMEMVKNLAKCLGNKSIAIPKIGCGLAGGDWLIVRQLLEGTFLDYDVTVYEL